MGVQWDPGETRSEKGDVQLQYKPEYDRVVNLGYRFRRGGIEQVDGSRRLADRQRLERLRAPGVFAGGQEVAGPVRRARISLLLLADPRRRAPLRAATATGDTDTSFLLQLELNGLSSVGVGADAFLERSIRGYSSGPPEP